MPLDMTRSTSNNTNVGIAGALHAVLVVTFECVMRCLFSLPRYRCLNWLKASFLRMQGAQIGKRVVFYPGVWIAPGRNLTVGNDVDFALDVLVSTSGGVAIGDRTLIGYRTQLISSNHKMPDDRGMIFRAGHNHEPIVIERDVWIGANCTILPGVRIGEGAVVGAGSVVAKDVEPFTVVGGVPAKMIRPRR